MNKIIALILLMAASALVLCVGAAESSWQAYLLSDGSVRVTDGECDGEAISALSLGLNETRYIEVVGSEEYSFRSTSVYVRVDDDGMLLCEGLGRATLRVYHSASEYVEIRINVGKAPSSIKLNRESLSLGIGREFKLEYTLSRDSAGFVEYYSSNEDVVSVNESGLITALSPGTSHIFAQTYNGKTAECVVTVPAPPPAVIEAETSYTGYAYESFPLNAALSGGFNETLSYASLNPELCHVDEYGTVSCFREGIAQISLRASGGAQLNCLINIEPAASSIKAVNETLYLYAGGSGRFIAKTEGGSGAYTAESLDGDIAVAGDGGFVTALKPGKTEIRLIAPGGADCSATLISLPFPKECSLTVERQRLAVGESADFSIASEYTAAMPFTFESGDESVLRVDKNGILTAVSAGKTELIAISGGLRQALEITVVPMATKLEIEENELIGGVGDTLQLSATAIDGGGKIIYDSSDERVAQIDESGLIALISPGNATLTASLKNGAKANAEITVYPAATHIYPERESAVIGVGDRLAIGFGFDEGCYSIIRWFSSDDALISMKEDGAAYSVGGEGEAILTAKSALGAEANITVNVINAPNDMNIDAERLTSNGLFTDYIMLDAGETRPLGIEFDGYTSVSYFCESLNEDIAMVTRGGEVTALRAGTARVRVVCYNGYTREILIEVV